MIESSYFCLLGGGRSTSHSSSCCWCCKCCWWKTCCCWTISSFIDKINIYFELIICFIDRRKSSRSEYSYRSISTRSCSKVFLLKIYFFFSNYAYSFSLAGVVNDAKDKGKLCQSQSREENFHLFYFLVIEAVTQAKEAAGEVAAAAQEKGRIDHFIVINIFIWNI